MKNTKRLIALLLGLCLLLGLTACTSSAPADTETPAAASDAETTAPETTEETQPEKQSGGAGIGLALIGAVLCFIGLGILIFCRPGKKGKYSR